MRSILKSIYKFLLAFGFDAKVFLKRIRFGNTDKWFYNDFEELKKQKGEDSSFVFGKMNPILTDRFEEGGTMKGHYFHQDLYVAREVVTANPVKHLDIGSRTDGFVAHVACCRAIEIVDIRPIKSTVKNIFFRQANLMQLPDDLIDYCDSVSSLHAIEHFGLGRYGDPIDYFGHVKAIDNIAKILKKGGKFYCSTPIGPQRIEFNGQRVFSINYLIEVLSEYFEIKQFSYVDDSGDFFENAELNDTTINSNFDCQYGCGIFLCIKK
jgi:SAM-dependent methyltransferase